MRFLLLPFLCLALAACGAGAPSGDAPASGPSGTPPQSAAYLSPNPAANLGSELLMDPGVEGSSTAGLNDSWHFEGVVQVALSPDAHGGSQAQQLQLSIYRNTPSRACANMSTGAPVPSGQWYRASFWAKRAAGSAGDVYPWIYSPGGLDLASTPIKSAAYTRYVLTGRATSRYLRVGVNNAPSTAPSDTVVVDDASICAVPFASLVALREEGSRYGKALSYLTILPGTQAGVVFCADSPSNPQNYLLAYHDGLRIYLYKVVRGVYTLVGTGSGYAGRNNPAAVYVPGAPLEIRRAAGANLFAVYYNGRFIAEEAVDDAAIVGNTVHGAFNTFEGNQVDYMFTAKAMNVVFLGGSITNGTGASARKNGWQWLLRSYLDAGYPDVSFSYTNAAVGGTDSWYSLIRLDSDVLAHDPDVVYVDEAVNDAELATANPAWPYVGEALIRRIRKGAPRAKIVVGNFMQPQGSDFPSDRNTETLRDAWNRIASYYHCDLYRMDSAILAALPANPTRAQIGAFFTEPGGVHPNDRGHALIFSGLSIFNPLAENVVPAADPSTYQRLGPYSADYEADPVVVPGSRLMGSGASGAWSTPGSTECSGAGVPSACCTGPGTGSCSGAKSSAPGSVLTYSAPMTMVGLEVALQNGTWPKGLQYRIDGGAWTNLVPQSSAVSISEFAFVPGGRGAHTLSLRLNSGQVTINRLLVL